MFEFGKNAALNKYKNLIGNTKDTINAIQKYINNYSAEKEENILIEDQPAASINRILESTACEETNSEIQKIINNL